MTRLALRCSSNRSCRCDSFWGALIIVSIFAALTGDLVRAQGKRSHLLIDSSAAPGAIGRKLLASGAIEQSTYQAVRILTPPEATVSTAVGDAFQPEVFQPMLGLLVGRAYRLKVVYQNEYEKHVVFPTVELIDRLDPPRGMEREFPVPIEFTVEDIKLAAEGNLVTRAVYVEDPDSAMPELYEQGKSSMPYFEARPGADPMLVANTLGRTIAIVRIGSRAPDAFGPTPDFMLHSPPIDRIESMPLNTQAQGARTRAATMPGRNADSRVRRAAGFQTIKKSQPPRPFMRASPNLFKE